MLRKRVIPVLLVKDHGLVKTRGFDQPTYVGDPINAIRIFNEKEVDELALLDIYATQMNRGPNFELVHDVASECFMPLAYGGGIRGGNPPSMVYARGIGQRAHMSRFSPTVHMEGPRLSGLYPRSSPINAR